MGIYPSYRKSVPTFDHKAGTQTWTEYKDTPGVIEERTVTATTWKVTERTDCFCCSCDDERPGSDPACRNHGWAAQRPCETHQLPGQTWGDEAGPQLDGTMPISVQAYRKAEEAR